MEEVVSGALVECDAQRLQLDHEIGLEFGEVVLGAREIVVVGLEKLLRIFLAEFGHAADVGAEAIEVAVRSHRGR